MCKYPFSNKIYLVVQSINFWWCQRNLIKKNSQCQYCTDHNNNLLLKLCHRGVIFKSLSMLTEKVEKSFQCYFFQTSEFIICRRFIIIKFRAGKTVGGKDSTGTQYLDLIEANLKMWHSITIGLLLYYLWPFLSINNQR